MKFLPIFVVLMACFVAKGFSDTIQCYDCEDCTELDDSLLKSCPLEATTATPTTTTVSTTSSVPGDSTPSGGSTTTTESGASTPGSTESTPTTQSTSTPTETTTPSEPSGSETTPSSAPEESAPQETRKLVLLSNQSLIRNRSYRSVLRAEPTYSCYVFDKVVGDETKVQRGCVEVPEEKTACEVLEGLNGDALKNCWSCEKDKCNSSAGLKFSIFTLLIVAVIGAFSK